MARCSRRSREVVGAPAIGARCGSVVSGLAVVFLRGSAVAVGRLFVSLGGAIVSLCRASQRGVQPGPRGPFPLLRCLERGLRALLPGVGVAGAPAGGEVCPPPAEVVRALRGEARGLRGDRARIVRDVHSTTIPRFPGAVSAVGPTEPHPLAIGWNADGEAALDSVPVRRYARATRGRQDSSISARGCWSCTPPRWRRPCASTGVVSRRPGSPGACTASTSHAVIDPGQGCAHGGPADRCGRGVHLAGGRSERKNSTLCSLAERFVAGVLNINGQPRI